MGLWNSIAGLLCVEITSASPGEMLTAASAKGITLLDVVSVDEMHVQVCVYRRQISSLNALLKRRGEGIRVLRRNGLFWVFKSLSKRPVLIIGMVILLLLSVYLPTRVLFVRVEGNQTIPAKLILDQAEACGIRFGASRRTVRSERIKNALLSAIPQLKWTGVNTYGCVAVISVEEGNITQKQENTKGVRSISALRDGIIRQITVTKGTVLCKVGQAVQKDQLLVSGYTDCGIVIKAQRAEAEIYAETLHQQLCVTPAIYAGRGEIEREEKYYSLRFGKNIINFFKDSGISDASCVKMYEEKYLALPGGFRLPVAIITETVRYYDQTDPLRLQESDFDWMTVASESYLLEQMKAGKIVNREFILDLKDDIFTSYGSFTCIEMIAKARDEECIETYGKRN